MTEIKKVCAEAKKNCQYIASKTSDEKNKMLQLIADALRNNSEDIIVANKQDLSANSQKPAHILDRLKLDEARIDAMAVGLEKLIDLTDPIGEIVDNWDAKSGINISHVRVPLGVIAIIYEARPNVTIDAIGLCLKTGNSTVLRGSKDAINSNIALVKVVKDSLISGGFEADFVQLVTDTTREGAVELMKCRGLVDVLIPRGSAQLINTVVAQSDIPVIETGAGNCHAYVNESGDFDKAVAIIRNGKLSRPSVCNALESIVVDESIAKEFLPIIVSSLGGDGVEVVGCDKSMQVCSDILSATDEDFYAEYNALKISVKVVSGVDEAIEWINEHSTSHSEVIISSNEKAIAKFTSFVDSSAVYANASTRFTDGFEFGFGAEMGISTQKLHARGPMGLKQLTSYKYIIKGDGQVRN